MNALNRPGLIRAVLAEDLPRPQRQVLSALIGLADEAGIAVVDIGLLAPMSGQRRPYVEMAVEWLAGRNYLALLPEGRARITIKALDGSFPDNARPNARAIRT